MRETRFAASMLILACVCFLFGLPGSRGFASGADEALETTPISPETLTPTDEPTSTPTPAPLATQTPTETLPAATPTQALVHTPTLVPTDTPTSTTAPPPVTTPTLVPLLLINVEPAQIDAEVGGQITLLGQGFEDGMVVRLVGYGVVESGWVTSSLVRAVVPAGLPQCRYTIQIILPDGRNTSLENGLSLALAPEIPTAVPTLQPTSDPRHPVLVVCSSITSPGRVKPGEEFNLTIEICNAGGLELHSGVVRFSSASFVPAGESRHSLGPLDAGDSVGLSQRLRVPASAAPGVYMVDVLLEANDPYGLHYSYSGQTSVEVAAPAPASSGGFGTGMPPRVVVGSSKIFPEILYPGTNSELILTLQNLGGQTASQVLVAVVPNEVVANTSDRTYVMVDKLDKGAEIEIKLPLSIRRQAKPGYHNLSLNLDFTTPDGQVISNEQQIGLDVLTNLSSRPKLVITSYEVSPEQVSPGDTFNMGLRLQNMGGGSARQVSLTLGGESGEGLKPFAPLGSGNVHFIPVLESGAAIDLEFSLLADGKAEARLYQLMIGLDYGDEQDLPYSDTQVVSLQVHNRAMFHISFYKEVSPGQVGQPVRLPIELANLSSSRFNVTSIEVNSDQVAIKEGAAFVGKLEPGGIFSLDVVATPQQSGHLQVLVSVNYLNDYNQPCSTSQVLELEVRPTIAVSKTDEMTHENEPASETIWQTLLRLVMGLFGLGS